MLTNARSSLTYANLMATVAVFVALGGTSYAVATGSIESREIKNGTVRGKDIHNNDVRSKDVRNRSLLARDFKAGQLPAGPQGPQGPKGEPGVEKVVTRTASITFPVSGGTGTYLSEDVQCQAGESVVGGGYTVPATSSDSQPNTLPVENRPALADGEAPAAGATPTGWFVEARRNNGSVAQTVNVYVLCASAG